MTYTYSNGNISHFALKRKETSCHKDPNRTRLIGVMCRSCKYYEGEAERLARKRMNFELISRHAADYIVCSGFDTDDEGQDVCEIRSKIYEAIEHNALCAL